MLFFHVLIINNVLCSCTIIHSSRPLCLCHVRDRKYICLFTEIERKLSRCFTESRQTIKEKSMETIMQGDVMDPYLTSCMDDETRPRAQSSCHYRLESVITRMPPISISIQPRLSQSFIFRPHAVNILTYYICYTCDRLYSRAVIERHLTRRHLQILAMTRNDLLPTSPREVQHMIRARGVRKR